MKRKKCMSAYDQPAAPLHCTHRTSTVPTAPLHCTHRTPRLYHCTLPTVPFFKRILSTNFALLSTNLALLSTNFALLSTNFWGTVGGVQWYGTSGTMVRHNGYSGAVQGVQWCSAEGTVVRYKWYSGTVQWYSARVQSTVRLTHGCMHTDGKSELSTCSPISNLAEVSPQHVTPKYTFVTPWFVVQSVSRLIPALRLSLAQQSCQT